MNNIREAVQKKLTSLVDNDMSVRGWGGGGKTLVRLETVSFCREKI